MEKLAIFNPFIVGRYLFPIQQINIKVKFSTIFCKNKLLCLFCSK